jgi:DNA-binding FadR family transcriptional regulator
MEARVLIEENLAGLAAQRGKDEQIAEIKVALDELKMCVSRHEPILDADMAFHMAIAHASRNNVLANSVRLLRNLMRQWLYYKVLLPEAGGRVLKHHQIIYRAIQQRKPLAARRAMRAHLEEAMAIVTTVMKQRAVEKKRGGPRPVSGS